MTNPTRLTVAAIAQREHVRTETVLRWIHNGHELTGRKLKATKYPSGHWRVLEADLEAFLEPVSA